MGDERIRLTALIALFSVSLFGSTAISRHRASQPKPGTSWSSIPYQMGSWTGADGKFDPIYGTDPADTSALRVYNRGAEPPVILYVGFYNDLVRILDIHTPEICYPSQGWTILSLNKAPIDGYRGKPIPATDAVVNKLGSNRLVVWWFNAGPQPIETRIRYVAAMVALSTLTGRNDGSLVRLETPFPDGDEAPARARVAEFEKTLLPSLDKALPR